MRNPRSDNTMMLILTAISVLCLVTLVGLYVYSGSVFPSTQQSGEIASLIMWASWVLMAGTPVVTGLLWLRRLLPQNVR